MKNKKQKTYQSSYRKQLIQLAKLYGVVEIKNYFTSAKRLTNSQIELILIKNKIKLPLKKSFSKFSGLINVKNNYLKQLYYTLAVILIVIGFFGGAPHLIKVVHKIDYDLWGNEKEVAKHKSNTIDQILKKNEAKLDKPTRETEMEIVSNLESSGDKNSVVKNQVSLSASVISTLFEDLNYDLKKIRNGGKVKPFYISLLPKDISKIENTQERKEFFIKIVLPLILQENENIIKDRKKLFKILSKKFNNSKDKIWLGKKFKEYKIENSDISELKVRMDIIPVSLAIAQAAKESGWGTSRFALEGNALFGQWTYSDNGLEPKDKEPESDHKIMQFRILTASVKAYKKNLNTHKSYKEFREARMDLRIKNQELTGTKLTKYLTKYAQTGENYVKIIELIIAQNSLTDFDKAELFSTGVRKGINL